MRGIRLLRRRALRMLRGLAPWILVPCLAACGYPALVIVLSQSGSGSGPRPVRVEDLELENTPGADRPADLGAVPVSFRLVGDPGTRAALAARVTADGATSSDAVLLDDPLTAGTDERDVAALAASPNGVPHRLIWDARANGISALATATVEVTATRSDGQAATASTTEAVGNLPPTVSSARVEGGTRDAIVLRFEVDDASRDPASVRIDYKLDGDADTRYRPIELLIGTLTGLPTAQQDVSVAWDSLAADDLAGIPPGSEPAPDQIAPGGVGHTDRRVVLRLTADDGLPGGAAASVLLGPIAVDNNLAPRAQSFFDLAQDRVGPLAIAFTLSEDEGDPVEVLVQWRLASEAGFPHLDDPAFNPFVDPQNARYVGASVEDPAVRGAVLQDAGVRRALHLVTEAPPALLAMVGAGSTSSTIIAGSLSGQAPPELFQGGVVRGGFAGATWTASVAGLAAGRLTLAAPLDAPPVAGAPLEVTLAQTQGRTLHPAPAGTAYRAVWDARGDLLTEGDILVRVTPFDRQAGSASASTQALRIQGLLPELPSFSRGESYSSVEDAEIADLNGDGLVDLALSRGADPSFRMVDLYLRQVDGTLPATPSATLTSVLGPGALASGDLDGDGRTDLLVTSFPTSTAAVHLQGPDGHVTSTPSFLLTVPPEATDAVVGDLDGDGTCDVAIASAAGDEVVVYYQSPTGSLAVATAPSLVLSQAAREGSPYQLALGDLNGDGRQDLLVANADTDWPLGSSVALYLQNPAGGLPSSAFVAWAVEGGVDSWEPRVVVGDFDGDGRDDLAVTQPDEEETWIYLQGAGGLPDPTSPSAQIAHGYQPQFAAAGDLDHDGRFDLATTEELEAAVSVVFGGPQGLTAASRSTQALRGGTGQLFAADVNGDGRDDLAALESSEAAPLLVALQNPVGPLRFGRSSLLTRVSVEQLASGDLNSDGRTDLVVAGDFGTTLLVHRQTLAGRIADTPSQRISIDSTSIAIGDVTGDGRVDVVLLGLEVAIYEQSASGTLSASPTRALSVAGDLADSMQIADLTGDGRLDLAVLEWGGVDGLESAVEVFAQGPDGALEPNPRTTLDPAAALPAGAMPDSLASGDVDGDGRTDLVVLTGGGGGPTTTVSIFLQTVSGTLQIPAARAYTFDDPSTELSVSVGLGDLNGDGRDDLVIAQGDNSTSSLAVYLQSEGTGLPTSPTRVWPTSTGSEVAVADITGDSRADLLVADPVTDTLRIYAQSASGALPAAPTADLALGIEVGGVMAADLNGDGILDLAIQSPDNDTLTILVQE